MADNVQLTVLSVCLSVYIGHSKQSAYITLHYITLHMYALRNNVGAAAQFCLGLTKMSVRYKM